MQMTMNLDEDLVTALREEMKRYGRSLEETVSHLLRRSLRSTSQQPERPSPMMIVVDPEVLSGDWTWQTDENGRLAFRVRDEDSP